VLQACADATRNMASAAPMSVNLPNMDHTSILCVNGCPREHRTNVYAIIHIAGSLVNDSSGIPVPSSSGGTMGHSLLA
ncbi:MAG: hypothetical protein ACYST5_22940, partial [Planctomycetota bacterium]